MQTHILTITLLVLFVVSAVFFFSVREHGLPVSETEYTPVTETHTSTSTESSTKETSTTRDAPLTFASDQLYGTWESVDDEKFRRTFFTNGTYRDTYEGAPFAETNGTWDTYPAHRAPDMLPFPPQAGNQYLELRDGQEVLYFTIASVSERALELVYLNRGGSLRFTKVTAQ